MKKPSQMKRTGKATAKPATARQKAVKASKNLGTGAASKGAAAIRKNAAARRKALKALG